MASFDKPERKKLPWWEPVFGAEEKDLLEDKSNKVIKVSGIPSIKDDPTSKIILAAQYDDEIYMGDKSCGYEDSWKIV